MEFVLKVVILLIFSPLWYPILKLMYHEVQSSLRKEGGLLGRPPTQLELERLERQYGAYEDPLVRRTWAEERAQRAAGGPRNAAPAAARGRERTGAAGRRAAGGPARTGGGARQARGFGTRPRPRRGF